MKRAVLFALLAVPAFGCGDAPSTGTPGSGGGAGTASAGSGGASGVAGTGGAAGASGPGGAAGTGGGVAGAAAQRGGGAAARSATGGQRGRGRERGRGRLGRRHGRRGRCRRRWRGRAAGGAGGVAGGGRGGAPPAGRAARPSTFPPTTTRADTVISTGWKHLRMDNSGAPATAFDDTAWASVTLPHTWNATDGQDGGSNYYRGIGWYRRHYTLPASAAGKRDLPAVRRRQHRRGRLRQRHDGRHASRRLRALSLRRDRGDDARQRQRHRRDGVERRGQRRRAAERRLHVLRRPLPRRPRARHRAGPRRRAGFRLARRLPQPDQRQRHRPPPWGRAFACATIRRRPRRSTVDTVVVRADGTIAARLSASSSVPAGASQLLSASTAFPNPHLWNGVADPYLYTVYAEVRVGGDA